MTFAHSPIRGPRRARVASLAVAGLLAALVPAVGVLGSPAPAATPDPRPTTTTALSGAVVGSEGSEVPMTRATPSRSAPQAAPQVAPGASPEARRDQRRKPRGQRYWRFVASDRFDRLDPNRWGKFEGRPGCCPDAWWDPSMVKVRNGKLLLHTQPKNGRMVSGGVGGWHWDQGVRKYGRWDARIRFDRGQGVSAAALLWPTDNGWPPELDFYEIFETWGSREEMMVTTHWRAQGEHRYSQRTVRRDFTQWHVASVRWTPNHIAYVLDGKRIKVDRNKPKIPRTPMWVGFQTHAHRINGRYPAMPEGKGTVALAVDWVKVYRRNR